MYIMETILLIQLITIIFIAYSINLNKKERNERYDYQISLEKKFREIVEQYEKLANELISCKKKHKVKIKK
jgi:uncharacterized protein YlxW (UPF0749 family)